MKKILVCLDGSKYSEKALNQAIKIAKKFNSKVFLIHVIESHFVVSSIQPSQIGVSKRGIKSNTVIENSLTKAQKEGMKIFEKNSKILEKEGISYDRILLLGKPSEEILNYAKEKKIDHIMIGSNGKGKLARILLGSTSTSVSQQAKCSVTIVK
ncbi:MAG: universal stress protein [Nitrosopumilaceae archaeon]|nr:universal stress protein [Nitrosopumilaceae archaeon]